MLHLTQSVNSISCYFSGICFVNFVLNCKQWEVACCLYVLFMLNGQALMPVSANVLGSEEQSTSVVLCCSSIYFNVVFLVFFLLLAFLFRKDHKHSMWEPKTCETEDIFVLVIWTKPWDSKGACWRKGQRCTLEIR